MTEFLMFVFVVLVFGIGWVTSCDSDQTKTMFISDHLEKPYCMDNSATTFGKTIHNKRCWKVIEVEK